MCRYPDIYSPVRHEARAEGAESEAGEEQHLGEGLEPAVVTVYICRYYRYWDIYSPVLADEVPLGDHGGLPEVGVEAVVGAAGHAVAQQLLVLGHVAGVAVLQDGLVTVLHLPGRRQIQALSCHRLLAPELLLRSDEARMENMSQT